MISLKGRIALALMKKEHKIALLNELKTMGSGISPEELKK